MALAVPLSRFTPQVAGGSAFFVRLLDHAMISKRQKWIMWSVFVVLILLSGFGVWQTFALRGIIPFLLNDSSPGFGQLPDDDRWAVYHEAQSLILPVGFVMLALVVLWAALTGFTIWKLSKKSEYETHDAA